MSIEAALARVSEIQSALSPMVARAPVVAQTTAPAKVSAADAKAFASALTSAQGPTATASVAAPFGLSGGGTVGEKIVAAVKPEIGVAEAPPGSNDSPRISEYRSATAGAPGPGPWCAYFTSWAAKQAGAPVGNNGEGFGSVDALYAWAQSAGKAIPAAGAKPQPGDLIVWDEHIGVVESVTPDGKINTIEGNSSDKVSQRTYGPDGGGALGYVRLG